MPYLPNTRKQQSEMLEALGLASTDDLFSQIPEALRRREPLRLPVALTEVELETHLHGLVRENAGDGRRTCLRGGGVYDHFVPAVVDEIASRGEYYTAYTPYQAEASQGSLQAFFEYQTLICQLTGMDVSNASLYEGGTSVAEAALMSLRVAKQRPKVVVLASVHPEYRQVLATYLENLNCELHVVPTPQGTADPDDVRKAVDGRTACLIVQQPNFFGCIEPVHTLVDLAHDRGALAVVAFDPISLGILQRPADYQADIAVAEGQCLGIPMQFGGPLLGILACRQKLVRQMPGRLIGQAVDRKGRRCFILNLQAREQHIRRQKATSNICTNQGLMALRAAIYLALLGPQGLNEVASLCCQKAHYLAERLSSLAGVELMFRAPFFKEFVLRCIDTDAVAKKAGNAGFDVGPALNRFPGLTDASGVDAGRGLLLAVTEKVTGTQLDQLVHALAD